MNVYIEATTLPHVMKFIAREPIVKGSYEFNSPEEAYSAPVVKSLFELPYIKKVYITANFIAIEAIPDISWEDVVEEIKKILNTFLEKEEPIIKGDQPVEKKQLVSIYAEFTPNPNTVKFISSKVITNGLITFKTRESASVSPLALALFQFPFVQEIFINENYISITQNGTIDWMEIIPLLKEKIKDLLEGEFPILKDENHIGKDHTDKKKSFSEDELAIESIIETYVLPAVRADGGYIELDHYDTENKTVYLSLQGACNGCPSSSITLQHGILAVLQQMLPEKVNKIEAVNS